MAENIVQDWIAEFEQLEPSQVKSYCVQNEENHEITSALFAVLGERERFTELSFKICNQFHSFYKSGVTELRRFTLQFLPIIVYNYLNAVSQGDKRGSRHLETLLIAIYNIEISCDDDYAKPKVISFRMPILAQASIYHEEKSLHPTDLRRWEENCNKTVNWGPLPHVEHLNAQNRLKVITALLFVYNQQLSQIQKPTLYHLCRIASQLVNQGFAKFERPHRSYGSANDFHNPVADTSMIPTSKALPRIPVSAELLVELTHAAYFVMFNEFASVAIRTIKDIHRRACFEMLPSVILVTGAVKNSLHANPSGQPSDGPMGISVALTPATTTVTVSKSMITNASFRAKKLPDDIPIQLAKDEKGGSGGGTAGSAGGSGGNPTGALNSSAVMDTSNQLQSINEEGESQDGQQVPTAAHLGRNTPGRQSKEFTAKLHHKVSFPNFKKLKESKESKGKSSGENSGSGGGGGSGGGKQKDDSQPSVTSAPMKRASILKDRLINRNSVPSSSDTFDGGVSLKMKNMSLDSGTSSASGGGVLVLGSSSGGNSISNNSFDLTESSSDPLENSIATRPSILPLDLDKSHNSSNGSGVGGNGVHSNSNNNNNNNNVQVYQM